MVRKSVEVDARIVLFLSEQTHSDLIICSQYQSKRNLSTIESGRFYPA